MVVSNERVVATNRRAYHDYFIEETYEAGLVLSGSEVKSVRAAKVSLQDGYVRIENGEAWLVNVHIGTYASASHENQEPKRQRKLLLNRQELNYLARRIQERGLTLIPLRVYLKGNLIKIELGVGRGKKQYDKREAIAEREARRQMQRALRREPSSR
ncbi:MAG: SsrA-binding protein SmpB [Chloroflexi bacterium]|nr:SsrA-binding protein SmpB [Chloroflexota bacterium]MCL5075582.1 SsrA-binding protein SmpB [Chloroflexota bacterium]